MIRTAAAALVLIVSYAVLPAFSQTESFTVHEWGTFTSLAGQDGAAERWVSLSPPADLPCFVYHLSAQCIKCAANRLRMETPVIYFYAKKPLLASVHVDLPSGLITEWYPRATLASRMVNAGMTYGSGGKIDWPNVHVVPGAPEDFPNAGDRSHYYAARDTDASPLFVGDQSEKVLFYRGIADFDVPVQPRFLPDGKLEIRTAGAGPVSYAMLFENRNGKVGFREIHGLSDKVLLDGVDLTANLESVHRELRDALVGAGLYPKEAAAMVQTWSDSWFEEGMRIFYLLPRPIVNSELPLRISPEPGDVQRVFVGRVELFSPSMRETIQAALETGDVNALSKYGRFLRPFCDRLLQGGRGIHLAKAASDFVYGGGQPTPQSGISPCRIEQPVLPTEQR